MFPTAMDASFFKNKKITVFGLGLLGGGVGVVSYLAEHGANVVVTDIKSRAELAPSIEKLSEYKNVTFVLGQHRKEDFTRVDMVVKTPAAPWSNRHIKLALEKNVPVETDASLFFQLCKNPIIGITGTKGKTTTTFLIREILRQDGREPVLVGAGRISVLDRLDKLKKNSIVVFELSSWRLSGLKYVKKSPHIAVVTNFFPDHLNYYSSMDSYFRDKKHIFAYQKADDWVVHGTDNARVREALGSDPEQQVMTFGREKQDSDTTAVYLDGEKVIYANEDQKRIIADLSEKKLLGEHNIPNLLAGIGAGIVAGVSDEAIREAIRSFAGVPHRMETVGTKNNVIYINDSAATVPEAAISAVTSFANPVVLIAGGSDKKLDLTGLAETIATVPKKTILLKGKGTEILRTALKKKLGSEEALEYYPVVESMAEAVEHAKAAATKGDIVLMSPGTASFGMFKNEFDRGDTFRDLVKKMK